MSTITSVLLCCADEEDEWPAIEQIQLWLQGCRLGRLSRIDTANQAVRDGGCHATEGEIWAGGFNGLRLQEFVEVVCNADWRDPGCVQLFIKRQDDEIFWDASTTYEPDYPVQPRVFTVQHPLKPPRLHPRKVNG